MPSFSNAKEYYLMVKMRMVNLYKTENVPDHIIEELKDFIMKLMRQIAPVIENADCNLILSSMNHILAMMVDMYISEDPQEIKQAARNLARGFLGNVKFYTGVDPMEVE